MEFPLDNSEGKPGVNPALPEKQKRKGNLEEPNEIERPDMTDKKKRRNF